MQKVGMWQILKHPDLFLLLKQNQLFNSEIMVG